MRAFKKEYQNQQRNFQKLEEQLGKLTEEKNALEAKLGDPNIYANKDEFKKLDDNYKQVSARHAQLSKDYDSVFEKMMELEEKIG